MRKPRNSPRLATTVALALLLAGAAGAASAADGFRFWVDALVIENLVTEVDTESAKVEEYRDLNSGLSMSKLKLYGASADGQRTLALRLYDVDREDARYQLDYGLAGSWDFSLDYNKIPHRFGNAGRMLFTRTGPGRYEIADPVQGALQAAVTANRSALNFAFLSNLLAPYLATETEVDIGLRRDRTYARLDLAKSRAVAWSLEYANENREGTRPYGATFGFNNITELPEPIDYQTTDATLAGEWGGKRGGLKFGYRYSRFENEVSTLIWDNPFRLTSSTDSGAYQAPSSSSVNGSSIGFADLAPENEASTLFLNGRAKLGGAWWASGGLSYITMTQDDPLLPYTLNSSIVGIDFDHSTFNPTDVANLPVRNADTEVDVLTLNGDLGARFAEDWSFIVRYRYYDYDNQSSRIELPGYVRFHGVWEDIPRVTVPYAYTKQDLGAELGWDVTPTTNLALSYNLQTWDREFREVESSDDDVLKLTFDTRPGPKWSLRASYEIGDRSIDHYDVEAAEASFLDPAGANNQPGLRKYDEAAREYDAYSVQAQFYPAEAWSFFFGVSGRDEDYDESEQGLLTDEILQYNFEMGYAPGADTNFYLFGHLADREVFQAARQSGATPSLRPIDTWTVAFDEVTDTWGVGLNQKIGEKLTLDLSGSRSNSDGDADFTAFPGGLPLGTTRPAATDFGNYEDVELTALRLKLDYTLSERAAVGLFYVYEDYTIDSFLLQGLLQGANRFYLPGALLLDANNGDYQADLYGVKLKVSF
jgi:MtrB/PioB family decaheme-associated outer membrane protein